MGSRQQQHHHQQSHTDVYMMADRDLDHLPSTDIADRDNALKRQVVIQVTGEGQDTRSVSPYFRNDQNEVLQQECGSEQPTKSFRSSLPPGQKHIFMTTPPKSNHQPFPLGHSSIKVQTTKPMALPSKAVSPHSTVGGTTRSVSPATRNISPAQVQVVTNHNPSVAEGIMQSNFLQVKRTQSPALIHALLQNRPPSPNQRVSPALISRNQEGFQQKIVVAPSVSPNRMVSATEPVPDGSSTFFITTDGNQILNQSAGQSQLTSIPIVGSQPSTQLFYMKKSPNVSQLSSQLKMQPLQGMQIKQDQLILNSIIVDKSQTASDKGIVSFQGTPSLLLSVPKANEHEQTLVSNEAGLRSSVYSPVMATSQSAGPSISPALLDQLTQARENITFANITSTPSSMSNVSAVTQAPILAKRLAAPATSSITFSGHLPSGLRSRLVIPTTNTNLLSTGLSSAPNVQLIPTSSTSFANPSQLNILSVPNSQFPSLTLTENPSLLQQVTTAQPTSFSTQQRNQIVTSNVAVNIQPAMVTSNPQLVPSITERLPVVSCNTTTSGNTSLLTSHPTLTERLTMATNPTQAKISQKLNATTNCENAVNYSAVVVSAPQLISAPGRTIRSEFPDRSTVKSITAQTVAPTSSGTNSQFLKIITPNAGVTPNQTGKVQKLVFTDHSEKSISHSLKTGFQTNQTAMLVNTDNMGHHSFASVKGDHQPQFLSMKPLSFEVSSDSIRLIEVQQGQPLKTTSVSISASTSTPTSATSSISNPVTSSNVNSLTNPPVTAKTQTVNALEYPKFSNSVLMPTLTEKIDQTPVTSESTVQKTVHSEMLHRAKQARCEIIGGDLDTSFPFPKVVPKESKFDSSKNARAANKNDEVNPFFAQLRASAASSSFSSSLSTVGALPYKTFQPNSSTTFHGQPSQLRRAVHSSSSSSCGFASFSDIGAAANSQISAYSLFSDSDRLSPSPPNFLSDIDQPGVGTSSEKHNSWDKDTAENVQSDSNETIKENGIDETSALKDDALSNNIDEKEPIPQPFSMRLQTLNNFPGNHGYKSTLRCHPASLNKAKVACITSTTKSLDLIRQNLQKFINKEIDKVIQEYIKKFFKPGIENIRFNNGSNAVSDEHMHSVCQKILEEAKKMYIAEKRSATPLRDIADNVSDSGSTSGKRGGNRKRRMSETDLDGNFPVQKKRKKGRPPLHASSGRVTPSKTMKQNEPVKREGPNWDPERLIPETLFVMGARANKALGFGATRGRLYIKHPELFKYSGDQDDKQWLFDQHHMPAIGGKAYILLYNDIQGLANTDEYRDNPNVILDELVFFTVPPWMTQKMKALMQAMRTDVPKVKIPTVTHVQHSNVTNSTLTTEVPSVTQPSNTSITLSSKLPFSTMYDDKTDSQTDHDLFQTMLDDSVKWDNFPLTIFIPDGQ